MAGSVRKGAFFAIMRERKMLNLQEVEYILFDWDNTLAESRTCLVATVNEILKKYNLPDWEHQKAKRNPNLSFRDNFPNVFGEELAKQAYQEYATLYKKNVGQMLTSFPKVKETLVLFKKLGKKIVVLTNKDRQLLDFELPLLFDKSIFDRIIAGHEAPKDKPYPEQAWFALKGWLEPAAFTPKKVWVVGDSDMDSDCALSAHAQAIRIGNAIWGNDKPLSSQIVHFDSFAEFYKTLQNLSN